MASPDVVGNACNYSGGRFRLQALIANLNATITKRLKRYNLFKTIANAAALMQSWKKKKYGQLR